MGSGYIVRGARLILCLAMFSGALISGCTYKHGDESIRDVTTENLHQNLVVGVTTREMVRAAYGPPTSTAVGSDGTESWTYSYGEAKQNGLAYVPFIGLFAKQPRATGKSLSINFDARGTVATYHLGDSVAREGRWE